MVVPSRCDSRYARTISPSTAAASAEIEVGADPPTRMSPATSLTARWPRVVPRMSAIPGLMQQSRSESATASRNLVSAPLMEAPSGVGRRLTPGGSRCGVPTATDGRVRWSPNGGPGGPRTAVHSVSPPPPALPAPRPPPAPAPRPPRAPAPAGARSPAPPAPRRPPALSPRRPSPRSARRLRSTRGPARPPAAWAMPRCRFCVSASPLLGLRAEPALKPC